MDEQRLVECINAKIGDNVADADVTVDGDPEPPDLFQDDTDYKDNTLVDPRFDKLEVDEFTAETYDKYLTTNVLLPCRDTVLKGKVTARAKDSNNNPVGVANNNPILDT